MKLLLLLLSGMVAMAASVFAQCSIVPADPQVCQWSTARFTAVGTGTVSWTGPNGYTSTGATAEVPLAQSLNAGVYTATINNQGTISTCSVTLVVNPVPVITVVPLNQTVASGGSATFSVQANSVPHSIYWWSANRGVLGTGQIITLTNVQAADAGLVYAVVVNEDGCGAVSAANLKVGASSSTQPGDLSTSD
jgi:hypothetical protein